ncbi:glycoside hydrolase [Achaetomium macrosporum]|uniref:Glycoside hydrolase n=1 Tax=Achaetomium macrosporum TaxID=79813 RepID=A0AAN7C639_9PEZI|nr:glycoside hydrolase [Achaetomium macrosporum]
MMSDAKLCWGSGDVAWGWGSRANTTPLDVKKSRMIHFTANSWINDPCAPGYDPHTKTYHLFYQCNPGGCEWGNMSWGHIVSKDMLRWRQAEVSPALVPDQTYDAQGVFTGCWIPPVDDADRTLRVAYSSVRHLPFHWSTPPYPRDAAGLSIALFRDGGNTWTKSARNPILAGEPAGVEVTGFRDPFVTEFSLILPARATPAERGPMLYGLVSGCIQDAGPTVFLYEIRRDNPEDEWRYLGPLVDLPARFQPSKKRGGNYGVNWECANLVALRASSEVRHFLIMGAKGDVEKDHVRAYRRPVTAPSRTVRAQLWMSGRLVTSPSGDGVQFQYEHGGYLDHGSYYAANSVTDPKSGRTIVYGWTPEEDLTLAAAAEKGWNGSVAIPRVIFLLRIPRVVKALRSELEDVSPYELITEHDGTITVLTLGVRPIAELEQLREPTHQHSTAAAIVLPESDTVRGQAICQTQSTSWELEATIAVGAGFQEVGFHLRHNTDLSTRTTVTFSVATETIIVERHASNSDPTINKCPDAGPFTLLTTRDAEGRESLEKLHIRIFSDGDILEVFANDRFALATMVYSGTGPDLGGLTAVATGGVGSAVFETVKVWDGLDLQSPRSTPLPADR